MSIPPNGRHVKPPRRYDSTRRRAQAAQTRQDILKAALQLFLEGGYAGTTINDVAAAAGVAVETIYRGFGSKAALFKGLMEAAIAGGAARAAIPPEERPVVRAMIAEQNPRRVLELHAAWDPCASRPPVSGADGGSRVGSRGRGCLEPTGGPATDRHEADSRTAEEPRWHEAGAIDRGGWGNPLDD